MADTRKLIVTEKSRITGGTGDHGEWTLYKLKATDENGRPIQQELRSFADCKVGEAAVYEVERQEYKGAEQFMLKPPKKGGASLGPKVDELRARVEALEAAVQELKAQQAASPGARVPAGAAAPGGDDDLPF